MLVSPYSVNVIVYTALVFSSVSYFDTTCSDLVTQALQPKTALYTLERLV